MIRNLHHHIKWYLRDEFMIQEQVEPVPINLWQWGIKNRNGHLREMSHEIIMMNLMPKNATVTFKGIRFKEMYYSCEQAILLLLPKFLAKKGGKTKVDRE